MKTQNYSIKKVKSFIGTEGYGYSCDLLLNGVKVGTVYDRADGGEVDFDLKDDNLELFTKYAKSKNECIEVVMGALVDDFENNKKFARLCKTKTLFRIEGDVEGEYRSIKHVWDDVMKQHLNEKYGSKVIEVYNEKLVA